MTQHGANATTPQVGSHTTSANQTATLQEARRQADATRPSTFEFAFSKNQGVEVGAQGEDDVEANAPHRPGPIPGTFFIAPDRGTSGAPHGSLFRTNDDLIRSMRFGRVTTVDELDAMPGTHHIAASAQEPEGVMDLDGADAADDDSDKDELRLPARRRRTQFILEEADEE